MKLFWPLVIYLSLACTLSWAQTDSAGKTARSLFYLEAGGAGGYGSVNFENCFFQKEKLSLSWRLGIFPYHINNYRGRLDPDLIIPVSFHVFYGRDHHIEAGLSGSLSSIVQNDHEAEVPQRKTGFSTGLLIGYRYQKKKGGLFFRIAYTPIAENNHYFRHWGGIAIGYAL